MRTPILQLFFAVSLLLPHLLYAQSKTSFTPTSEQQQTVDSLTSVFQQQGVDAQTAYTKAYKEVYGEGVDRRYATGTDLTRPLTPHDSSIRVDRDSLIHTYMPSELIKKILLKAKKPAYAGRIKNVQYVGVGGDGTIDQTVWKRNDRLHDDDWDAEDRSLSYFEGDPQGRFPLVKGLVLSSSTTHAVEGPNDMYGSLGGGVNSDHIWGFIDRPDRQLPFDVDITHTLRLGQAQIIVSQGSRQANLGGLIEFDFSPASTEMHFDYIFGSESYDNSVWVHSGDVFGFYISGPFDEPPAGSPKVTYELDLTESQEKRPLTNLDYTTMQGVSATPIMNTVEIGTIDGEQVKRYNRYNIARLPNGDPVGINSVNWGRRFASWITDRLGAWGLDVGEYIYPNVLPFDEQPNAEGFVTNISPNLIRNYHRDTVQVHLADQVAAREVYNFYSPPVNTGTPPTARISFENERGVNMAYYRPMIYKDPLTEMNGLTTKLTAKADSLIPNKWYHLKLVVASPSNSSGSVVFLSDLDLGETTSVIDPIPEKEGSGWNTSWDTIYGAADNPLDEQARFPLYSGSDRTFTTVVTTPLPGSSYLVFKREGMAKKEHLTLFLNGKPMTSDSVFLKNKTERFNFTMRSHSLPTDLEGEKGRLLTYNSATSVIKDTVIYYTAYNHPTANIRYRVPTVNYQGMLDLGLQGGTPHIFRSVDQGKNWTLASEPFSARELMRVHDADTIKILLRAPNSACDDILIPFVPATGVMQITRTIQIAQIPHVTLDKRVGLHTINSGDDFELIVTPNTDQSGKEPIIRTNRKMVKDDQGGLEVTKRDDGSYHVVIKNVTENLEITVDMAVVSNEASIENGHVWSRGKQLFVHATNQQSVAVYTLTGAIKKRLDLVAGETRSLLLPAGVYLVRLNETGEVYKVLIKE